MTSVPDVAMAAPTRLDIRAWLEEDGIAYNHVSRFQDIAETRAARTVTCVILIGSTSPDPTVLATAVPENAPTRFMTAAKIMAWRGVSTRVEMELAMALAVSWNPLIKSKITARTITAISR